MSNYMSEPGSGRWVPAEPLPWQEEHNLLSRIILYLTGVEHCGKAKYQWGYSSRKNCKCCQHWAEGSLGKARSVQHTCGKFGSGI